MDDEFDNELVAFEREHLVALTKVLYAHKISFYLESEVDEMDKRTEWWIVKADLSDEQRVLIQAEVETELNKSE